MLKLKYIQLLIGSLLLMTMAGACTDYDTPDSIAEDAVKDSISSQLSRRVLWINIDGGRASVVKQAVEQGLMPNVAKMLEHSKYSWTGLSDARDVVNTSTDVVDEDPVTWASMLTGVNSNLHKIDDYSYTPNFSLKPGSPDNKVTYFPTMVQYLGNKAPEVSVAVVTPWEHLNRYLGDANSVTTTMSDEETFETTKNKIANDDYRFFIISFKNVLEAGKSGGFSASNGDYMTALSKADEYAGQLLDAIESRENTDLEDWLIVISSNIGGGDDGAITGLTDAERDVFGVFYFNHYTPQEMKGEKLMSVLFDNHGTFYAFVADSLGVYGIGEGQFAAEFTFQNMPKTDGTYAAGNWYQVLGKEFWGVYRQRQTTVIRLNDYNGSSAIQDYINNGNDMLWHHYYYAFDAVMQGGRSYLLGTDGKTGKLSFVERANALFPLDDSWFKVGLQACQTDYRISTIRLWNRILSDTEVTANAANGHSIDKSNPRYLNLLGEWELTPDRYVSEHDSIETRIWRNDKTKTKLEVFGHIKNNVQGAPNLYFVKPPKFIASSNTLPAFLEKGNLMMENTMIAPQILYWFCGLEGVDSKLCGYPFLKNYAIEEQWRDSEIAE